MTLPLHDFPDWQQSLQTADLAQSVTNQALNAGNFFSLPVQDMRAYSSFSVQVEVSTVAAPTAYNGIGIVMDWRDAASVGNAIYEDVYWIFPKGVGGGVFNTDNGRFECQDAVHGPFCRVTLFNNGVDNCTTDIRLFGNSRALGRRYVQNTPNTGGVAVDMQSSILIANGSNLGPGATETKLLRMAPGPVTVVLQTGAAGPYTFNMFDPLGLLFYQEVVAAGAAPIHDIILPRCAVRFAAVNTAGVANGYFASLVSGRDNW